MSFWLCATRIGDVMVRLGELALNAGDLTAASGFGVSVSGSGAELVRWHNGIVARMSES